MNVRMPVIGNNLFVNWHSIHDPFAVAVYKEIVSFGQTFHQGVYCMQCKHLHPATIVTSAAIAD